MSLEVVCKGVVVHRMMMGVTWLPLSSSSCVPPHADGRDLATIVFEFFFLGLDLASFEFSCSLVLVRGAWAWTWRSSPALSCWCAAGAASMSTSLAALATACSLRSSSLPPTCLPLAWTHRVADGPWTHQVSDGPSLWFFVPRLLHHPLPGLRMVIPA